MIGPVAIVAGVICAYASTRRPRPHGLRVLAWTSVAFGAAMCTHELDAAAGVFEALWVMAAAAVCVTFLGPLVRR